MKFQTALKAACAPIALSVALVANPASAQDADPAAAEEEADESEDQGTIFVTGSRIRRDEFSSASPITLIDPEIAVRQGLNDTGAMVQGSPIASGSSQVTAAFSSQFLVNGGQGVQTVSLRGLGAERTLVLLNSRRAGPAGTRGGVSSFDLNVLPQSIIARADILKDGASSIYGSDAVAGVVNLITKTDTDGIEFEFFGSVPQDSGGEQWSASATWGTTFDRGHVLISGQYFRQNELERGDRDYLQCAESYVFDDLSFDTRSDLVDPRTGDFHCSGAASNVSWGHVWTYDYSYYYSANGPNIQGSAGQADVSLLQFSYPGDNLGNFIPGVPAPLDPAQTSVPAGWFAVNYDAASRSVFNNYHPLMNRDSVTPETDRYTIYLDAAYELFDGGELYTELLYNKRETYFDSSGQIWQFGFGQTLGGLFGLDDSVGDPQANGFGGAALFSPTGFLDWYDTSQEIDYYRGVLGMRGDVLAGFTYDLYGQWARSDGDYTNQVVLDDAVDSQDFRGSPFGDAASPCAGTGFVTPISGRSCVDVDWYSPRVMFGDLTQQERNFLLDTETGNTKYTQWYVEGVVSGDLITLPWSGPVGIALGGTFRKDKINDVPGEITLAGNVWQGLGAGITAGNSETLEGFGEISIPLLEDLPLVESLELSAAARVTNVTATRALDGVSDETNGNWTYKLAGNWEVTDFLRLRATYGTSFRAPALFEQFLADQQGGLSQRGIDPCIGWGNNLALGNITQRFADNCAADGVPANHTGAGISAVVIQGGGLGVLEPETSTAWTVGAVLTPSFDFLPDTQLSLAVEYFDIEVKGEIAQLGARQVLSNCYSSDNFPDDPVCSLFARINDLDPSSPFWNAGNPNNVAFARDSFINVNNQNNTGVDVTARLVHDFAGDATFSLQGLMTWQTEDNISLFDGFEEQLNGELGEPKWVGDFNAQLDMGPWNFFYGLDVVGKASNEKEFLEDTTGQSVDDLTAQEIEDALCSPIFGITSCRDLSVSATFYHSASITREIGETFRLTAGMSNIFNTRPPRISNVADSGGAFIGNSQIFSQYDLVGRRVFLNVNVRY